MSRFETICVYALGILGFVLAFGCLNALCIIKPVDVFVADTLRLGLAIGAVMLVAAAARFSIDILVP